jgi:hypothetical protein
MCQFYIGLTLVLDISYPCLYYAVRRQEEIDAPTKRNTEKKTK